ncbi:hypothetical protein, partial [Mesorhizobium sp. M7A.F.Ca.AU.001.01.1.1]
MAVGARRGTCMHHDAMVWRPEQTMDPGFDMPGGQCYVGRGSGRGDLREHAFSIHGKTCSRLGNSRAIFNAVAMYLRLSIKLG